MWKRVPRSFGTYSFEGALGGGFSDRVRGRIAGRWEKSDGYVKAGSALGRDATGRTSNGADGFALRGTLQIDATDNVAGRPDRFLLEGSRRAHGRVRRFAGGIRSRHGPRRVHRCHRPRQSGRRPRRTSTASRSRAAAGDTGPTRIRT